MNEKQVRLDEILFKLYISNEHESEKGSKSLHRKAKALEIDEETLKTFIDKRLDKYSQAEDFLNEECTKNPIPEETKREFLELCVDLEISGEQASQLLNRKLSSIPKELTPEEKKKEARLQRYREQGDILAEEHKTTLPKTGFSFTVSVANALNIYYFLYQNAVETQWKFFMDSLAALNSGSQVNENFMKELAIATTKPLFATVDEIINDNKKYARSLSNDGNYTDKFKVFFQACLKVGRNTQDVWEQGQTELAIYNEAKRNSQRRSTSIVVGNLGFMVGYAALKGLSAAAGKINEKIQERKFASEFDKRFLNQFMSGAVPYFEKIYEDCVSTLWADILFRLDTHDYFTFAESYLPAGEVSLKLLKSTKDLAKFKDKIEAVISSMPWYLPLWNELIGRYDKGTEERQELLEYARSLSPLHSLFFKNESDENLKMLLSQKVPAFWQDAVNPVDAADAVTILKKLLDLQARIKSGNIDGITEATEGLRPAATTDAAREYLDTAAILKSLKETEGDTHEKMIAHLFVYELPKDAAFSYLENQKFQKLLLDEKRYIEKYISKQDFQLYSDAGTAADQLARLIPVIELEEKEQWKSAVKELEKDTFAQFPKALLTWHKTACSLMSGNDSLAAALNAYSSLTEKERIWLSEYEKKVLAVSAGKTAKQFFSFAQDLWTSEIGKKIEKQIPSKNKNNILAQITAASAFLAENQKKQIKAILPEINVPSFRYGESLGAFYGHFTAEAAENENLEKFLTDFPDVENKDISLILGAGNKKQADAVFSACNAIRQNLDDFDKKLLSGIMSHQAQAFPSRHEIFSKYLDLRDAEVHENWQQALKNTEPLLEVNKYGLYFEVAKLYFEVKADPENKTRLRAYIEAGTTLEGLRQHWPHGKWEKIYSETYQTVITDHKSAISDTGIIDLSERLFNYSFSRKYSVCHADDSRISKSILPEINAALKKQCGLILKPEDIMVAFRSTNSDGVITPWGMISCHKSTKAIKHTYWINGVKADRCWGATLRVVMKDGEKDDTPLEAFSYDPIDELVKVCDFMISFWSDIRDDQVENLLNGKFYQNPANWILLFSGERKKIHVFEIAEFEEGEISNIIRETSEKTQENLAKNETAATGKSAAKKSSGIDAAGAPGKITKTAASEYFSNLNDPKILVFPNIPREKLESAVKGFDIGIDPSDIVVLVDNTLTGVADEGIIITLDAMYSKSQFEKTKVINFDKCGNLTVNFQKRFLRGYAIEINGMDFASIQLANTIPEFLDCLISFFSATKVKTQPQKKNDTKGRHTAKSDENGKTRSDDPAENTTKRKSASRKNRTEQKKTGNTGEENSVPSSPVQEEKSPAEVPENRKYRCSQCGKEYPEGPKFCSECGGKIEPETVKSPKSAEKKKTVNKNPSASSPAASQKAESGSNFMELFSSIGDRQFFMNPNIPPKKLNNALGSYAPGIKPEDIIVLIDDTVWGGAREGIIVTKKKLYSKALMESPVSVDLSAETKMEVVNGNEIYVDGKKLCSLSIPDKKSLPKLVAAILEMCKSLHN